MAELTLFNGNGFVISISQMGLIPTMWVNLSHVGENVHYYPVSPLNIEDINQFEEAKKMGIECKIPVPIYPKPDFENRKDFEAWLKKVVTTAFWESDHIDWRFKDPNTEEIIDSSNINKVVGHDRSSISWGSATMGWAIFKGEYPEKMASVPEALRIWLNAADEVASNYYKQIAAEEERRDVEEKRLSLETFVNDYKR